MRALGASDFAEFFRCVHGFDPFPWQQRLAEELLDRRGTWPDRIALPTASGKTACVDIAVFVLACQAFRPASERSAPRRVFFVVDRRVIVDQTLDHARKIADTLKSSEHEAVARVAQALRDIGADPERPLDVYALRGGMYRESAWVRSPLQPTVLTTTVDQIGSRLLFGGYGVRETVRPMQAALVAMDSLIVLDEAHVSRPFEQTLDQVRRLTGVGCGRLRGSAVQCVTMSATPRAGTEGERVFTLDDKDRIHAVLGKRLSVSKMARLQETDAIVDDAVKAARAMLDSGRRRVGVIVNRVASARDIARSLREPSAAASGTPECDVELLTGRMRPIDRDLVTARIAHARSAPGGGAGDASPNMSRPIVVVATQTIEVGADLDFDGLVTECASLDALRQRFGRLNRLGEWPETEAVVLAKKDDVKKGADDPIYGTALAATWQWLSEHAEVKADERRIDMSAHATERGLKQTGPERAGDLMAPTRNAATLLAPHLDLFCQTGGELATVPDVGPFLRGAVETSAEVSVVFRADVGDDPGRWAEIVSLCQPSSAEALPVRIGEFRRWLCGDDDAGSTSSDVEGQAEVDTDSADRSRGRRTSKAASGSRRALVWNGDEHKAWLVTGENVDEVRPNTILIVPVGTDEQRKAARELADVPSDSPLDVGDAASCQARDMLVLRLHSELYPTLSAMSESIGAINAESADQFDIDELIDEAIGLVRDTVLQRHNRPERERVGLELDAWSEGNGRVVDVHPLGGVVVHSRRRLHLFDPTDSEERVNSLRGAGVEQCLVDHCDLVGKQADHVAEGLGLPELERRCVELAARFHDVGKADPRFQALLRGNRVIGDLSEPLAKSSHVGRGWSESRRSGWPMGERHEFYSVRMVGDAIEGGERAGLSELTGHEADLVLHLIAAHHGHARPFAPVVIDQASDPSAEFELEMDQQRLEFRPVAGAPRGTGHGLERADSGVAERFWRLTRHYGWWGLAYLEAIVRLADWKASEIAGGDAGNGTARRADVCERQTQEASR